MQRSERLPQSDLLEIFYWILPKIFGWMSDELDSWTL